MSGSPFFLPAYSLGWSLLSLGLDPSLTSFGWAISDQGILKSAGTIKTLAHAPLILRFSQIKTLLKDLLTQNTIHVIGLESPAFYGETSLMLYGLYSIILELAVEQQKFLVEFTPQTLKFLAGVKTSSKFEMVEAAKKQIGTSRKIKSDIADAFFVSYFGFRFLQLYNNLVPVKDLTQKEKMSFLSEQRNDKGKRKGILFRKNDLFYDFARTTIAPCVCKTFTLEEIVHGKARKKTKRSKQQQQ